MAVSLFEEYVCTVFSFRNSSNPDNPRSCRYGAPKLVKRLARVPDLQGYRLDLVLKTSPNGQGWDKKPKKGVKGRFCELKSKADQTAVSQQALVKDIELGRREYGRGCLVVTV